MKSRFGILKNLPSQLFNAKSFLYIYIYIKYIRSGLVEFYGISTIVDYLMPNPVYSYISNVYDLQTHFVDMIFKRVLFIFYTLLNVSNIAI